MARCAYCESNILFGGKRLGEDRFCNDRCLAYGSAITRARQLPPGVVDEYVRRIHAGPCPKCHGPGPVDVHTSHSVWSALILTSWRSSPQVSCRSCGAKSQAIGVASSLFLGWW